MQRSDRLFQLIQLLRAARRPLRAEDMAAELEVSTRTLYRDIATLQSLRVPVEGAAGIGYLMRRGYDLPPLMFSEAEIEALLVGIALLRRTADRGLTTAAASALGKIRAVLPEGREAGVPATLFVSAWQPEVPAGLDLRAVRAAIGGETCLRLDYRDAAGKATRRTVRPLALVYYADSLVLAAWCELRRDFRHFRPDRIARCRPLRRRFVGEGEALRRDWRASQSALAD